MTAALDYRSADISSAIDCVFHAMTPELTDSDYPITVIPAQAGIYCKCSQILPKIAAEWIPACAAMTVALDYRSADISSSIDCLFHVMIKQLAD